MINMNIVPNDILSITKLLKRIISHTTHWSHQNQASHALKQGKTSDLLLAFQNHVSHVSWVCGIILANHVSLRWVAHVALIHFIKQHTWNMTICCNVSQACFMQYKLLSGWMMLMFMKCKCKCRSQTPRMLHLHSRLVVDRVCDISTI